METSISEMTLTVDYPTTASEIKVCKLLYFTLKVSNESKLHMHPLTNTSIYLHPCFLLVLLKICSCHWLRR